jgi:hypothetical protein
MANQVNGPNITVELGEAVTASFTLLKLVSGIGYLTTGVASEDNALFGIAQETGSAGDKIQVRCINCVATSKVKAAAAITKGVGVFTAASGLGSSTATSLTRVGIALDAATAANDIIEVAHVVGGNDDIS